MATGKLGNMEACKHGNQATYRIESNFIEDRVLGGNGNPSKPETKGEYWNQLTFIHCM
jgi:hypothetical protein